MTISQEKRMEVAGTSLELVVPTTTPPPQPNGTNTYYRMRFNSMTRSNLTDLTVSDLLRLVLRLGQPVRVLPDLHGTGCPDVSGEEED